MKVYQLMAVLKGNNSLQLTNDSLRKLGKDEKARPLCRADFWHKYRKTAVWDSEIDTIRTDIMPDIYGSTKTIVTIELAGIAPKRREGCAACAMCANG